MVKISVITPSIRPEGLKPTQECLAKQTFKEFEWLVEMGIPERGHDLNAAFNRMIRRSRGRLAVFLQDYIHIQSDGLEKFWKAYQDYPDYFFTAPVGKTLDFQNIKWDWRKIPEAKTDWIRWEIDWGSAPISALYEIGGFDEQLDQFWSFDNVSVGLRASLAGYKFGHLPDNPAVALDHDKLFKHPFREKYNPDFHNMRLDEFRRGIKINYIACSRGG